MKIDKIQVRLEFEISDFYRYRVMPLNYAIGTKKFTYTTLAGSCMISLDLDKMCNL
jgi:hypothetical protein